MPLEIAKEFLKQPFDKDIKNVKGYKEVKTNFHHIANDVVFGTIEAGKLTEEILETTAEKYGVSPSSMDCI